MDKHVVITIGRQLGSGGREIGYMVAEKLGIKCYDKELLNEAAKESGLCEKIFEVHDEKPTRSFLYSLVMDTYAMGYAPSGHVDMPIGQKLFLAQFDTIKTIAERESCVIVGRCADYALEENPDLISLFIHGDMDTRIKRIMEKRNISKAEDAKDLIIKTDKQRASYYNSYASKKWGDAKTYNMSIDSGLLGTEGTADLIVDMVKRKLNM